MNIWDKYTHKEKQDLEVIAKYRGQRIVRVNYISIKEIDEERFENQKYFN